jgi:hypothetical protein
VTACASTSCQIDAVEQAASASEVVEHFGLVTTSIAPS